MMGSGANPPAFGAGGFDLKPKRRRVATENAMTKANPSEPKRALFSCVYCQKDISGVVRIKCAECAEMHLCVDCFSVGVEPHPHRACHAYHVVDDLSFPLFTPDWGADEELLLLEAIEMYGLGNWTEVSEHVGTKSKQRCHAHYFDVYVNSPTTPLPDMTKVLGKGHAREEPKEEGGEKKRKVKRENGDEGGEGGGEADDASEGGEEEEEKEATLASFARPGDERHWGNAPELTGFNVKRDEFDPEYDIDAELPLAEMEFRDTDTELDRELKLRMLEIYNARLAERRERKRFIIDRGLLNVKRQQALERKRTPQEREIHGAVRVFARFLDPNEYEIMLEGLAAESRIRNRIAELKEYRRAGIHTISEGEVYDAEKRRRAAEMARLRALGAPHAKGQGARANKYLSRDGMFLPAAGASAADGPKELLKLQQGAGAAARARARGKSAAADEPDDAARDRAPVQARARGVHELQAAARALPLHQGGAHARERRGRDAQARGRETHVQGRAGEGDPGVRAPAAERVDQGTGRGREGGQGGGRRRGVTRGERGAASADEGFDGFFLEINQRFHPFDKYKRIARPSSVSERLASSRSRSAPRALTRTWGPGAPRRRSRSRCRSCSP